MCVASIRTHLKTIFFFKIIVFLSVISNSIKPHRNMELELGLKFTRTADESTSDFRLAKDQAGPLFLSRETETMFVLTAHLKGYNRTNIKIDINEDGSLIGISGEKQVQETVMVGWRVYKKDTEKKGFKKLFRIPKDVILDEINAKFDEDESTLTISMPKKVKGIQGKTLEEVKENEELVKEGSGNFQIADEKIQEKNEKSESINESKDDKADQIETHDLEQSKVDEPGLNHEQKDAMPKEETENVNCANVGTEVKRDQEQEEKNSDKVSETVNEISEVVHEAKDDDSQRLNEREEKRFKICVPIVASSALLLSLVVFVFQIMRSKNQTRRKD